MVDADAEPDVLLDSSPFDVGFIAGMASDGADLWVINNDLGTPEAIAILRIDPTTLEVVETFRTPDANVEWMGIAFVGERMFLLGADAASEGVIAEVAAAS